MQHTGVIAAFVLAFIVYFCARSVRVNIEVNSTIDKDIETVFSFTKDPLNQKKIQNTITDIKVTDKQTYLDETDGHTKDTYKVIIQQNFPHLSGARYQFTKITSSAEKVIESRGYVLGITYSTTQSLTKKSKSQTEVKEISHLQLPWILSVFMASQAQVGHEQRMLSLKHVLESA